MLTLIGDVEYHEIRQTEGTYIPDTFEIYQKIIYTTLL